MKESIVPQRGNNPDRPAFDYPKKHITSYAQNGEDILLWRALHSVDAGFYIDIGAHDPTAMSVTRAFYEHGWRGINVEPSPFYAEKLRRERPRDVTMEVALGRRAGTATLYDFGETGLSTMVKEIADGHIASGLDVREREISVTTLETLLGEVGDQPVHFLKIDVEGFEETVLAGSDFSTVRPWIVLVEAVAPTTTRATYESWEPILLNAGYEFAFFDGLNRYYISNERLNLMPYFSVPVNICDPFARHDVAQLSKLLSESDRNQAAQATKIDGLSATVSELHQLKAEQAGEIARLSTELRRSRTRHDIPQLEKHSKTPIACDVNNADALLHLVEAQSSSLVRLRRSLVAAQSLAAQRLDIILLNSSVPTVPATRLDEWARSIIADEIERVRAAIVDVVRRSRWRRIGQKLGLAGRLEWEDEFDAVQTSDELSGAGPGERSTEQLLSELSTLAAQLEQLRRSRWRKLGQQFGLAKRLPWESGAWPSPLLGRLPAEVEKSFPAEPRTESALPTSSTRDLEYAERRFIESCRTFSVDAILDVGANTGQFAQRVRTSGYQGHIISFEPLTDAHTALVANAASDPLWDVVERSAVGASEGWSEINIAGNSYSSSLLPMLESHRSAAPQSTYVGIEQCPLITLDGYIERTFSDPSTLFGLKIDTQGYEGQVLDGLSAHHHRVKAIICEMSLTPLYSNGIGMFDLCRQLAELGYQCIALGPGFADPKTGELLQVDGVFVKPK